MLDVIESWAKTMPTSTKMMKAIPTSTRGAIPVEPPIELELQAARATAGPLPCHDRGYVVHMAVPLGPDVLPGSF